MTRNEKSLQALFSGNYDNDTINLNENSITDMPEWLYDKYEYGRSEWKWLIDAIRNHKWKSGFKGNSLYFTDGNIDVIIGENQARFKVYKITPDIKRIAEDLSYSYNGKDENGVIDVVIQKRDIEQFIKDLLNDYVYKRTYSSHRPIKSSTGTIQCVYVSDIPVSSWNKELALSAIKNNVTNYGYYEYNGRKGCCIVGDFDDIYNFIESNGYTVDEYYIYHWKEFNWDSAKKLDKQYTGQDYFDRQIKSSREQKAISKFLDKNGNLVNFDRWSYNKYNSILRKTVDSCAENLALYKDDLKKMDKFVIYETEPNGNIINTLYECSRSEFLDMVREHYKEYTGNYPDEDKFDSERWSYINSSRRPIKSETYRDVVIAWSDDFPSQEMASLIRDKFDISVSYFVKDGDFAIAIPSWNYNSKILNFIKRKVNVTSFERER